MAVYNTVDSVSLAFIRLRSGAPVTGLTVTVKVNNVITGATLLSTTTLTEITPGVYSYNWTHGQSVFTDCVALYTVGGVNYAENFQIDEALNITETLNGHTA